MHSQPSLTSKFRPFTKIVKGFPALTIFAETAKLEVVKGSEYVSGY